MERLLTSHTLAEILQVHPKTIALWHRQGRLPQATILNGQLRWRASVVDAWILAGCPAQQDTQLCQLQR